MNNIKLSDFVEGFVYEIKDGFGKGIVKTKDEFNRAPWVGQVFSEDDRSYIERMFNSTNAKNGLLGLRKVNNITNKIKSIRHYLAPFNKETRTQSCALCGQIIHDYSNAMYSPNLDGSPTMENGWKEGEHYLSGKNPTIISSTPPPKHQYNVILCTLKMYTNKQ